MTKESTAPDFFSSRFIKAASKFINSSLPFLINQSIQQSRVPNLMKTKYKGRFEAARSCLAGVNSILDRWPQEMGHTGMQPSYII